MLQFQRQTVIGYWIKMQIQRPQPIQETYLRVVIS